MSRRLPATFSSPNAGSARSPAATSTSCSARPTSTRSFSPASPPAVSCSRRCQAADLDYRLVVLADAFLDGDAEVHRVLTEKVFPRQAEVLTVDRWVEQLNAR